MRVEITTSSPSIARISELKMAGKNRRMLHHLERDVCTIEWFFAAKEYGNTSPDEQRVDEKDSVGEVSEQKR